MELRLGCVGPDGTDFTAGSVSGLVCACASGQWQCGITSPGGGVCDESAFDAGAACPAIATSCDSRCTSAQGATYDSLGHCQRPYEVITCQGFVGETTDGVCLVRSDGLVVIASSTLEHSPSFTACSLDMAQTVVNSPPCP